MCLTVRAHTYSCLYGSEHPPTHTHTEQYLQIYILTITVDTKLRIVLLSNIVRFKTAVTSHKRNYWCRPPPRLSLCVCVCVRACVCIHMIFTLTYHNRLLIWYKTNWQVMLKSWYNLCLRVSVYAYVHMRRWQFGG